MNLNRFLKNILTYGALLMGLTMLSACSDHDKEQLKSPCAGTEDSPCGPRRPVNDWWLS